MTQEPKSEKAFFDDFASNLAEGYFSDNGWGRLVKTMLRFLPEKQDVRVLDLGCGAGRLLGILRQHLPLAELVGVDISEKSIELARSRYRATFIVDDIQTLDLASRMEKFDFVILSSVIHHFQEPFPVFECVRKHLREDGLAFSYDPNAANPFFWLYRSPRSPFHSRFGVSPNEKLMSRAELAESFMSCGFDVESFGLSGIEFQWVASRHGKRLLPVFNLIDRMFFGSTRLEESFGAFVVCVARLRKSRNPTKCHACGETHLKRQYAIPPFTFLKCGGCGTVQAEKPFSLAGGVCSYHEEWPVDLYHEYYRGLRKYQADLLLDKLSGGGGSCTLLDVGCGNGFFLQAASERGYDVEGIDISLPDEGYCCVPGRMQKTTIEAKAQEGQRWRVVSFLGVLEHIHSPGAFLEKVRELIRPGGEVAFSIPLVQGPIYRAAEVLYRCTFGLLRSPWLTLLQLKTSSPHVFLPTQMGVRRLIECIFPSSVVEFHPQPIIEKKSIGKRVEIECKLNGARGLSRLKYYLFGYAALFIDHLSDRFHRPNEGFFICRPVK